jgi:hypothetical protein
MLIWKKKKKKKEGQSRHSIEVKQSELKEGYWVLPEVQ